MGKMVFEEPDGKEHNVDIANGQSIMEGAVKDAVAGIDADCGGACSCATCMVYVPEEWLDRLPAKDFPETAMLQFFPPPAPHPPLVFHVPGSEPPPAMRPKVPSSPHY